MRGRGMGDRLKGLRRVRQGGRYYVYHRATGTRMPDLPETHPDFLRAYLAAEAGAAPRRRGKGAPGSILAVWHGYCTSDAHRALSPAYARMMERAGDKIVQTGGHVPIREVRAPHIRADLKPLSAHAANLRLKAWRLLLKYAVGAGYIADDPSIGIGKRPTPAARQRDPWTPKDVARFRAHWPNGTAQRVAFELLHWTGARISDVVGMGEGMVDRDGWLTFRQRKTGGAVSVPFRRDPPAFTDKSDLDALHAAIAALPSRHLTWVTTARSTSRSSKSASQWFAAAARAARVSGKSAHGLRVTRAILLAEAGATTHQIGAWTGHESLSEIGHYSRAAEKKRLLSGADEERKLFRGIDPEQKGPASG